MTQLKRQVLFAVGRLGLRSAERQNDAAHWAIWADMLKAFSSRVPSVATNFIAVVGGRRGNTQHPVSAGVGFVVPAREDVVANSFLTF